MYQEYFKTLAELINMQKAMKTAWSLYTEIVKIFFSLLFRLIKIEKRILQ